MGNPHRKGPPGRSSGVLLHVSSLPGPFGIGDLGPGAFAWVEALARAKQSWWQILPLCPPAGGLSPYQCFSAFAGNPDLISPESLLEEGLIDEADHPRSAHDVRAFKSRLLHGACERFASAGSRELKRAFSRFVSRNSDWLDGFALFMALKEAHHGKPWTDWPAELRSRQHAALASARQLLRDRFDFHTFVQFLFHHQLDALRRHARAHGIGIIGDIPMYVSADSADVWSNPSQFLLDHYGRPKFVAGVPPDYFSKTGQRWGHPLYNWSVMRRDGFAWWVHRIRASLAQADLLRIDHFRGLEAFWAIPASRTTAQVGRWMKAPGEELLRTLHHELGRLPFIAEDLGLITPAVARLRDEFNLPGMRILQFAFDSDSNSPFLPHNYPRHCLVYTGTHDNDTTAGWYASLDKRHQKRVLAYTSRDGTDIAWDIIRLAWSSVARIAIVPAQDVLGLGSEARMNLPGRASGNWKWRLERQLPGQVIDRLAELTELYGRIHANDCQ
jgi:4-alpha-glucanotransferase